MDKNWSLYLSGVGEIDVAQDMLTNFVSQFRDNGLTITDVSLIEGTLHPDLAQGEDVSGEDGWTMTAYGTGDIAKAYGLFPTFLGQFKDAGIDVLHNGIVEGTRRSIPVAA